jgi:hypothetical protein
MSYDKEAFINYEKWQNSPLVYLGDSTTHAIEGQGDVAIKLLNNEVKEIPNVLHIPGLTKILFSMIQFDKAGGELNIKKGICTLKNNAGKILTTCSLDNDLYKLGCTNKCNSIIEALPAIVQSNKAYLWHHRLGQINKHRLHQLKSMSTGLDNYDASTVPLCHSCLNGKQHRDPFPKSTNFCSTKLLELIHSDLYGPINPPTSSGISYFLTFIDDKSRYTIVYLLKHKFETFGKFQIYKELVEN